MVKRCLLYIVLMCCAVSWIQAQDIHFTQYYFSPLNYNPSYTGRFDGDFRVVGNYRSQWGAVMDNQFTTSGLSYEQVIPVAGQKIGLGAAYLHDNSGLAKLMQNKLLLSAAYTFLWKGNTISAGAQGGLLHKGVNYNALTFPNQYNQIQGNFDNGMDNNQNFMKNNDYLADVNLGLSWGRQIGAKLYPEIGAAFMHINQPTESFLGSDNRLPIRSIYDIQLNYSLSPQWTITPTLLYMTHTTASEMLVGGIAKHHLGENKYKLTQIFTGVSYRDGYNRNYDAAAIIIGGVVDEFQVGISYDFNISELSSATHYKGAFELSIIYIAKRTSSNLKIVPCDRL